MNRQSNSSKKAVELRPSRIRREPAPTQKVTLARSNWHSREWEIGVAVFGMILFALAINALWFGINFVLSQ